jgi:pimeloyl-ACP methyl ester carboxylesterase
MTSAQACASAGGILMHLMLGMACAAIVAGVMLAAGSLPGHAGGTERRLTIDGLALTYLRPEGTDRVPLAVIIAGSGPTDRDGNSLQSLNTDAYKQLAAALADLGIATVRYDKRGVGGSADLGKDENLVTIDVFAKDAQAIATWAKQLPNVGPIVLIGHSEGGVLALMAAKPAGVKAVVLLATPGRPLGQILRDQVASPALPSDLRAEAMQIIAALERGEEVKTVRADLEPLFRPSVQPFMRSWIKTDPAQLLRGLAMPALVIGGGRDIQVARVDFDALVAARADIKSNWYPTMGHTLKSTGQDLQSQGRAYMDPTLALAEGLADAVARFIHEASGGVSKTRK